MTRREVLDTLTAATAAAALLGPQKVFAADTPSMPGEKKSMPDPFFLDASLPIPPRGEDQLFHFGETKGRMADCMVDGVSLRGGIAIKDLESLDIAKKPAQIRWVPAMGEMHFSRVAPEMWLEALQAMHAGGLDIVSTYIFWIHHEEEKGVWDWVGRRNLRDFLAACKEVGIHVILRLGPWCHGEVRNGGLPDWLVADKAIHSRTDDPKYLEYAKALYEQIAAQAHGSLYRDGGPVIGVQLENEYGGPAEHLLTLKRIAVAAGFDVPLYTRTGWPHTRTPMPFGELLPLSGAYAEGFWDRVLTPMPGAYSHAFHFELSPDDAAAAIGTDILGAQTDSKAKPVEHYPFLCCEMGGGMMSSYHRRIRIDPRDIESLALVKLGSGNNLPGFYMYHGGINPEGKLSTLQESQATHYANDLPIKNYDFQAPVGAFGQTRPHYHGLRRMHLFLRTFGDRLAPMPARLPAKPAPGTPDLRWAARTDGKTGLIFVNNYERLKPMPAIPGVRFAVKMANGETLIVPDEPVTVPADSSFFWPFRWDMTGSTEPLILRYATAQPITTDLSGTIWIFAQTPGVRSDFIFEGPGVEKWQVRSTTAREHFAHDGRLVFHDVKPGAAGAIELQGHTLIQIVLLDETQSRQVWKDAKLRSVRRPVRNVYLSPADVLMEGHSYGDLTLAATDAERLTVSYASGGEIPISRPQPLPPVRLTWESVKPAGNPPPVALGSKKMATPADDATFAAHAAIWRLHLPAGIDPVRSLLLKVRYTGDIARLTLNGKLIYDDFYNGEPFEIGLKAFAPDIYKGELLLHILPLRKDAPVYFSDPAARPDFRDRESVAALHGIDVVESWTARRKA